MGTTTQPGASFTSGSYTFVHPTSIWTDGNGMVNVLDQGTNTLVVLQFYLGAPWLYLLIPLPDTPLAMLPGDSRKMVTPSGLEYLMPSPSVYSSVQVTTRKPTAFVTGVGGDWITDGSGNLYQVTAPTVTYSTDPSQHDGPVISGSWQVTTHNLGSGVMLGSMVYDGRSLWIIGNDTSLLQLDPSSGSVVGQVNIPIPVQNVTYDGTFLWVSGTGGVRRVDPLRKEVSSYVDANLSGSITQLYFDGSWVWTINGSGTAGRARACDLADIGELSGLPNPTGVTMTANGMWSISKGSPVLSWW